MQKRAVVLAVLGVEEDRRCMGVGRQRTVGTVNSKVDPWRYGIGDVGGRVRIGRVCGGDEYLGDFVGRYSRRLWLR